MTKTLLMPWPWSEIPEPRPADWGFGMTVCIACHCQQENSIVVAADSMLSTGDMSAELGIKMYGIGQKWITLYAGNDVSVVDPILREVRRQLSKGGKERTEDVANSFITAIQAQLIMRAENEVLLPLGYTMQEFKSSGLTQLGTENFTRLLFQVEQQRLDVQFLVAGFDQKAAEIFTVSPPGRVADFTNVGFWAIGSGQTNALGSLFNLEDPAKYATLPRCVYRVFEAKFNAETAVGVGKGTHVAILRADGTRFTVLAKGHDKVRSAWNKTRARIPPPEGTDAIKEEIDKQIGELTAAMPPSPSASQTSTEGA
ncbi:MAG TPA: hypothetical protein VII23_07430 [Terriglobales bacterium]